MRPLHIFLKSSYWPLPVSPSLFVSLEDQMAWRRLSSGPFDSLCFIHFSYFVPPNVGNCISASVTSAMCFGLAGNSSKMSFQDVSWPFAVLFSWCTVWVLLMRLVHSISVASFNICGCCCLTRTPIWASAGSEGSRCVECEMKHCPFPTSLLYLPLLTSTRWELEASAPSPAFGLVSLCKFSATSGCVLAGLCGLDLHFPGDSGYQEPSHWKRL